MGPMYILYLITQAFVLICKSIEWVILRLFSGTVEKFARRRLQNVGIIFHYPSDPVWSSKDDELAKDKMVKNGYPFNTLIHANISNKYFFSNAAQFGILSLGESYMDQEMVVESPEVLTEMMTRILVTDIKPIFFNPWRRFLYHLEYTAFNLQSREGAEKLCKIHYDLSNKLFESFLDPWMQYTCGYWANTDNLNDAQIHKMELIAKKLDLKPGMRVLDIGCGWGTLCKYLAQNYGVSCVGVSIGHEGVKYGQKICQGLPVDIRYQDYRDIEEKFDRIVSVGMFEHVGSHNYKTFFKVVNRCLEDDGIFLLHTIGMNHAKQNRSDAFAQKYVFPYGSVPDANHITKDTFGLFIVEDWHNFGLDYAKTLRAWRYNFNRNWPNICDKFDDRFYRMWNAYLSGAASMFLSRYIHLWQIVMSKDGLKRDYRAAR